MSRNVITGLFDRAGIEIDGPNPWDIQIHDDRLFGRVLREKNLGLGEAYMDGWWDCREIDGFIFRLLREGLDDSVKGSVRHMLRHIPGILLNHQSMTRSHIVAKHHHDSDNALFLSFLDPYHQYSCAYFHETDSLEEAQLKKLDLICRKLDLRPGDHVLDIGSGWDGLGRYIAEYHLCRVTGVDISVEQIRHARKICRDLPVSFLKEDYRHLHGRFDKIISVGMFEHAGRKNHGTFMEVVHRCLDEDGTFLLQTVGGNASRADCDPWINRYILPNGTLPSIAQIGRAVEGLFVVEDWQNLGPHYDRTLMAWNENFKHAWKTLKKNYDDRFRRMWEYFFLSCAGAFRARSIQLWQIVMTKTGAAQPRCRIDASDLDKFRVRKVIDGRSRG